MRVKHISLAVNQSKKLQFQIVIVLLCNTENTQIYSHLDINVGKNLKIKRKHSLLFMSAITETKARVAKLQSSQQKLEWFTSPIFSVTSNNLFCGDGLVGRMSQKQKVVKSLKSHWPKKRENEMTKSILLANNRSLELITYLCESEAHE